VTSRRPSRRRRASRIVVTQAPWTIPAKTTQTVLRSGDLRCAEVSKPWVWWPYSMGDQPLYRLDTAVSQNDVVSTSSTSTFGIRTVGSRLVGKSPAMPEGARQFSINGKDSCFVAAGSLLTSS